MPESKPALSLGTAVFSGFSAVAGLLASLSPKLTTFHVGEVIVDLGMLVLVVPLISKTFKVGGWRQETWLGAIFSGMVLVLCYTFWIFGMIVAPICVVTLKRISAAQEQEERNAATSGTPSQ